VAGIRRESGNLQPGGRPHKGVRRLAELTLPSREPMHPRLAVLAIPTRLLSPWCTRPPGGSLSLGMSVLLIADPDPTRVSALRSLIRREGHRTLLAADGPSALDKVQRSHPALVLADVGLPGLDGYGLALSIREDLSPDVVRILLVKSEPDDEDRTTANAVGADGLVARTADDEDILDALRAALAARHAGEGGLAGQFDQDSLFDMIQFIHQRRTTGTLSLSGTPPGTLVFAGGEIIGAHCRGKAGVDAFHALLRSGSGRYCFDSGLVDPSSRNIEQAFDPLMMDAFAALG
jgi:CheY-like chemotaxis protein